MEEITEIYSIFAESVKDNNLMSALSILKSDERYMGLLKNISIYSESGDYIDEEWCLSSCEECTC